MLIQGVCLHIWSLADFIFFLKETRQIPIYKWAEEQGNTFIPENTATDMKTMENECKKRCQMERNKTFRCLCQTFQVVALPKHPGPEYFAYNDWGQAHTLRMKNTMQIRSSTIAVRILAVLFWFQLLSPGCGCHKNMSIFSYIDYVVYSVFSTRKRIFKILVTL